MSEFLNSLKVATNMTHTTNGALTYKSTLNKVYDLFAQGAAMRNGDESACRSLFMSAYHENPTLALKCLFYLRDIRGGQGERRFFRIAIRSLAQKYQKEMSNLVKYIPEFGRWDDLYTLVDTPLENEAFAFMKKQIMLDLDSKTPSLLAKWLKSENTSSQESVRLATKTRLAFGLSARRYRKMLSLLRNRINIVETLMSQNRWDEIEFDKLPSRAGIIYKNAFARHDITKARYEAFIKDENTKVNAGTLYPYDVVHEVSKLWKGWYNYKLTKDVNDVERLAINKYWDNLTDYFNGATLNALAVVDTSGSMTSGSGNIAPIDVAIALGMYCADRAQGPFHNHFISFSRRPTLIEIEGVDFCEKVSNIYRQNLCENTNIEATFDLLLNTAKRAHLRQDQLPQSLIVISDMQFDRATGRYCDDDEMDAWANTLFETINQRWENAGYEMPHLIFWNVNAASGGGNIPMRDSGNVTYVSGASPVILEQVLTGKTGQDVMLDKLMSERYAVIKSVTE